MLNNRNEKDLAEIKDLNEKYDGIIFSTKSKIQTQYTTQPSIARISEAIESVENNSS